MNSGLRLGAGVCLAALAVVAMADVPREMTFQGRLTGNGIGPVDIEVRFYDAETGGSLLWSETHPSVPRPEGLFTINIGSQTSGGIPDSVIDHNELWVGIAVGDGAELTPRVRSNTAIEAAKAEVLRNPNANDGVLSIVPDPWAAYLQWDSALPAQSGACFMQKISSDFDGGHRVLGVSTTSNGGDTEYNWYMTIDNREEPNLLFRRALRAEGQEPDFRNSLALDFDGTAYMRSASVDTTLHVVHSVSIGTHSGFEVNFEGSNNANFQCANDIFFHAPAVEIPVLRISGGSDLAEPAEVSDAGQGAEAIQPGMVVSIDPKNPGKLMLATEAYDRKVAGVISGAGGVQPGMIMKQEGHPTAEGEHPIAMAGKVYVWCDADAGGPITPGDRLTASATPGHAMKVTNNEQGIGAVIGKAMTQLNEGKGLVLMLVQPQ